MAGLMAAPVIPISFPHDQEHQGLGIQDQVLDAIHSSDKPLYIRSKGSDVHVGPKFVFEIPNENVLEKIQPLIKSISQSSSDVPDKSIITEIKGKQSHSNKSSITDDASLESDDTTYLQNSNSNGSRPTLYADSITSSRVIMGSPNENIKSGNSFLLTPDFFQTTGKQSDDDKITDSSKYALETTTHSVVSSDFPVSSQNTRLKLTMPNQCVQHTECYSHPPVVPYQQSSFAVAQNTHNFSTVYGSNNGSYSSVGLAHSPAESSFTSFTTGSHVPHTLTQSSFSLPIGSPNPPLHKFGNLPRVKLYDQSTNQCIKTENSSDYHRRYLNRNFMEERGFILSVSPGIFYDTPNGIVVEMKNYSHYQITLANKSCVDCDVDLEVDMEPVYKIRLKAYSQSPPIEGPQNNTKKFVFIRAFDAVPEANIIYGHERNGQIKAVFKPKLDNQFEERGRAWSADAAVSCSQFLNQAIGNIMKPPSQRPLASSPPATHSIERYRSGSWCSGATALQGSQREIHRELAEFMKVDENRTVVLQLRLVARTDDQSRPTSNEQITPLITQMPPPLLF